MKKIIVVGMSAASVSFVVKLRSLDKNCEIICFSGEKDLPYNRCFLADFLTGDTSYQELLLKPESFFEQHNIQIKLDSWVTNIDINQKSVYVGTQQFFYDYLFLGVGTKPFELPCVVQARLDGVKNIFNFHTLSDMQHIAAYVRDNHVKTACVIGGGLNGIEAVSSLKSLRVAVSVIEAQSTLLSGQVDDEIAQWLTSYMRLAGVAVFPHRRASQLVRQDDENTACYVQLDTGARIGAGIIIIAAGSVVNIDLVRETDIATSSGSIVVDEHMQTNIPGIFAGGDVCLVKDMMTGALMRSTTWADAMLQGLCAATNIGSALVGGAVRRYPGMLGLRDSYFFGKDFYACGQTVYPALLDIETIEKIDEHGVQKWYLRDGELKGFVLIGDVSRVTEYKRWYVTKQKIQRSDII